MSMDSFGFAVTLSDTETTTYYVEESQAKNAKEAKRKVKSGKAEVVRTEKQTTVNIRRVQRKDV